MAMYISIDESRVRIKRSDSDVGGTFWKIDGENASCVFKVAWGAKQENADRWGHMYDVLKAGKTLRIRRNNEFADAMIFAATGVAKALEQERAGGYEEEEFSLLYAS